MSDGTKRSQRDYAMAFKLGVVSAVEKGELTYKEAQKKYGIQGRISFATGCRIGGVDCRSAMHQGPDQAGIRR